MTVCWSKSWATSVILTWFLRSILEIRFLWIRIALCLTVFPCHLLSLVAWQIKKSFKDQRTWLWENNGGKWRKKQWPTSNATVYPLTCRGRCGEAERTIWLANITNVTRIARHIQLPSFLHISLTPWLHPPRWWLCNLSACLRWKTKECDICAGVMSWPLGLHLNIIWRRERESKQCASEIILSFCISLKTVTLTVICSETPSVFFLLRYCSWKNTFCIWSWCLIHHYVSVRDESYFRLYTWFTLYETITFPEMMLQLHFVIDKPNLL